MAKHVLYISYDGMTDPLGQSQVLSYLKGLSERDFTFSLISFEKPERFEADGKRIHDWCRKNNIDWYPQTYTKTPPVISTMKDIRSMFRVAETIQKTKPIDLLHCRSYISALAGLRLKKKHSIPWIFDMRGFWADERVEGNIWNLKNPLFRIVYKYFKKKERQYLLNSDAIVSLTHAGKKEILKWDLKLPEAKITVIPCCADLELFDPETVNGEQKNNLKKQLGLQEKFVLGYVGSIGTWYNLKAMLQTFDQLLIEKSDSVFLFLTKEPADLIYSEAKLLGIDADTIVIRSVSHKEIPVYISLFDTAVFYINPSFSKTASSPVKQGELMAMGIPVICNSGVGDTTELVRKYNSGIVTDLIKVPSNTAKDYDLSGFDRTKTLEGAREYFSLETGVKSYEIIYKQLADR